MPEGLLEGRVVLVTGAAGGIGRALVPAALALFLASPEARHITDATVVLSGGLVMP